MSKPEIALCLTTYQKPWHLKMALRSIARQENVRGKIELVVTDDGSTDETPQIVERFRREVDFPVAFTTHEHTVFHPSRSRNEGVAATSAPYLLFLDGDCVLPANYVTANLAKRRPGRAMLGDCYRMEQEISQRVGPDVIDRNELVIWNLHGERRRLMKRDRKIRFYSLLRHPRKPKLLSGNCAIWREDYERINGFDENFRGWGREDDDLGERLLRAGVRLNSILRWTNSFHLWHPREASAPREKRGQTVNDIYHGRKGRLTRCRNGLVKRGLDDLALEVIGRPDLPEQVGGYMNGRHFAARPPRPEVEALFLPGQGKFSRRADCRLLVVLADCSNAARLAAQADIVVADRLYPGVAPSQHFRLSQWERALESIQ